MVRISSSSNGYFLVFSYLSPSNYRYVHQIISTIFLFVLAVFPSSSQRYIMDTSKQRRLFRINTNPHSERDRHGKHLSKFLHNREDRRFQIQFGRICRIDMDTNSRQRRLDRFLGSTVQHFITDWTGVRVPRQQHEFRRRTAIVRLEFQIDKTVPALVLGEFLTKILIRLAAITRLLDLDRFLVLDLVDVIAELVSSWLKFEALEGGSDFVVDNYTGGLVVILSKNYRWVVGRMTVCEKKNGKNDYSKNSILPTGNQTIKQI